MRRAWLLLLALPATLLAQDEQIEPPALFLERSYFAPASPLGHNYVFTGEAALHLPLWHTTDQIWLSEGGRAQFVRLSYRPVARMRSSASEPVRTPSYNIGLAWQLAALRAPTNSNFAYRLRSLSAGITHYSNGQEGCLYRGYTRDADDRCEITDAPLAAQRRFNLESGDFSTTFLALRIAGERGTVDAEDHTVKRRSRAASMCSSTCGRPSRASSCRS
jgi:hypothetical protein